MLCYFLLLLCQPTSGSKIWHYSQFSFCKLSTKVWGQPIQSVINAREVISGRGKIYCLDSSISSIPNVSEVEITIIAPFGAGFAHDESFEIDIFTFDKFEASKLMGIYFFSESFAQIPLGDYIEFLYEADIQKSFGELNINVRSKNDRANLIKQTLKDAFLKIGPVSKKEI